MNFKFESESSVILKIENHLVLCFMSQLQIRNKNQNFISNLVFQFIKKMKWHFRFTDSIQLKNRIH